MEVMRKPCQSCTDATREAYIFERRTNYTSSRIVRDITKSKAISNGHSQQWQLQFRQSRMKGHSMDLIVGVEDTSAFHLTELKNCSDEDIQRRGSLRTNTKPRTYEHDPEKGFTMDVMMLLDKEKVASLRHNFQQNEDGLTITEFVHVMLEVIRTADETDENLRLKLLDPPELIANLCELFAQIDINGDGTMEWEEFTSFIVETGLMARNQQKEMIHHYYHVQKEDLSKHSTFIDRLYYFPDKDFLGVIEQGSSSLKLYNHECELQTTLKSRDSFILSAEYLSRDKQYVLSCSDHHLRFYDDTTHRLLRSYHTTTSQSCLRWYTDSKILFSSGVCGIIYAWDMDRMEESHQLGGEIDGVNLSRSHGDTVLDLLNITTLESLASASLDRSIRLWDVNTGKLRQNLEGHEKGVRSLAYSSEYRFLISAGFDLDVFVWNPYVKQLISRLHGHNNSLCGVEIIPDTGQIISADVEGILKVWDIRNFGCIQTFTADNIGEIGQMVALTSRKQIVVAGKKLVRFDFEKIQNPQLTDDNPVFYASYNSTSMSFITAAGRAVKIWDAGTGRIIRSYRNLSDFDLTAVCLDARERRIVVGDHDGNIQVINYLNGYMMKKFEYTEFEGQAHHKEISCLSYCGEDMNIISASWDCCIHIHDDSDSERGHLLRRMMGGHTVDITALSFSHTLSLVASGSSDMFVQVWNYEFGHLDQTCIGHVNGISALQFIDPYPLLLASDIGGNLCFWALRPYSHKGKCVYRVRNQHIRHGSRAFTAVRCMAVFDASQHFHANGKCVEANPDVYHLITGDDNGLISVWDIRPLLNKLESDYGFKKIKKTECSNSKRKVRVNVESTMRRMKKSVEYIAFRNRDLSVSFVYPNDSLLLDEPSLLHHHCQWKAHQDMIYSLHFVPDTLHIVSSSFDRHVNIWSLQGENIGVFLQGDMDIVSRNWKFEADYEALERRKKKRAASIITKVQENCNHDIRFTSLVPHNDLVVQTKSIGNQRQSSWETLPPLMKEKLVQDAVVKPLLRTTRRLKPVQISSAGRAQIQSPRQIMAMKFGSKRDSHSH